MPFACCLCCGNVVEGSRELPEFGKPAGPCPGCGRTMYSAPVPFAELAVRQRAAQVNRSGPGVPQAGGSAASRAFFRPV